MHGAIFRDQLNGDTDIAGDYAHWIRSYDRLQRDDLKRIREQIAQFDYSPLISVLLPVYNSNLKWLEHEQAPSAVDYLLLLRESQI